MLEDGESGPKNWFCSFLTTITASVSNGKYQAKFPMKALLPHSAEVVSFNLYDTTMSFLKFWYSKSSPKTMMETDSESSQSFFSSLLVAESSCSCQWECLKVLSSSSGHLIGLVLTPNESITCEAHPCNTECILVAVLQLNQWGIQWNFVANLQDAQAGTKPSTKWVDFQLSDMFLACLNATGFVAIWDVKTGGLATSFSALQRCRTGLEMPLRSSTPDVTNLDAGNISIDNFAGRMFKRLVLASYSHLLAVVDEAGVVYVFYADDTLNFKANVRENFDLSVMNHFGDCLSAWEAAGHEIGSLSFSTHQSRRQGSLNPAKSVPEVTGKNDVGIVRPRKRRKCRCDENEVDSWPSGFIATGKMKVGAVYPNTVNSSSSLRRVLLPPCRSEEDVISLSPLGLMRIFKSSNADGNEHVKIFHTELVMNSFGERDTDAGLMDKRLPFKKNSAFVGDSVVCYCQGYLYLITQCGLSVVLPPVSISSFSSHDGAIKFWQSGFTVGSTCNALNLLPVDRSETRWKTWQIEVLDRALLYEGPSLADRLCWENGVFYFSWLYLFRFICVNILLHGWSCCSILTSFLILWSVFTLLNILSWICFH